MGGGGERNVSLAKRKSSCRQLLSSRGRARAELARASCQIVHGKSCHRRLAPVLPSIPIHRSLLALRRVALPLRFAVHIAISA